MDGNVSTPVWQSEERKLASRRLVELFQWFHENPELSFEEQNTTAKIKKTLIEIPNVKLLDLGLPTGALAAIYGDPGGPTVGLRADIDALPIQEESGLEYSSHNKGRMHACGHDFHTTALLGAAFLLAAEYLPGTVVLLFQPAEEASFGARRVVETGRLQALGVKELFGEHVAPDLPAKTAAVGEGATSASVDRFLISVCGKGCHAAHPELGRDPIPAAARLVCSLQDIPSRVVSPFSPVVVSVTRFTAGSTWNIIPERAEIEGTVRTFSPDVRKSIEKEIRSRAGALQDEGYNISMDWTKGCPSVINDPQLVELVREVIRDKTELALVPRAPSMGGEDFSEYQTFARTAFVNIGIGGPSSLHTSTFRADPSLLMPTSRLLAEVAIKAIKKLKNS